MRPIAACSVAVRAIRRRPLLGVAAGIGALALIRPSVPRAAMRLSQVTPSLPSINLPHYRSQSTSAGLFSLSSTNSIMASLNPPQAAPKWTHTPEEVLKLTTDAIAEYRALEDKVAALKPEECNFESVGTARRRCSAASLISLLGIRKSLVITRARSADCRSHYGHS